MNSLALSTIDECLTDNHAYLKKTNKINEIYSGLDADAVKQLFLKYCYNKKLDLQQVVQKNWKNNLLTYKTEKGFKSNKLDDLFKLYYQFLTNPPLLVIQDITKYNKIEIVAEKYDLHYDINDDVNIMEICVYDLRTKLNDYFERFGRSKPCTFTIKTQQFNNIL